MHEGQRHRGVAVRRAAEVARHPEAGDRDREVAEVGPGVDGVELAAGQERDEDGVDAGALDRGRPRAPARAAERGALQADDRGRRDQGQAAHWAPLGPPCIPPLRLTRAA